MADNGTAASRPTIAWDDIGGVAYQRVKLTFGTDGSATDVSASNKLPVDVGTVAVTGTFWQATQPVSGTVTVGNASLAVTGTFWQATQPVSGTVAATQSGTWNIGSITTLPALAAGTNLVGKVGFDQTTPGTTNAVAIGQIGSTTVATGNGVVGAGVQRVAIASDNTAFSVNATASGNVAHDGVDSGNPVKVGAKASSNPISGAVADSDRTDLIANPNGALFIAAPSGGGDAGTDGRAALNSLGNRTGNSGTNTPTWMAGGVFNGTSWDRQRGDVNGLAVQSGLSATWWKYTAASGGIVSSTADVALKAAAGAGVKNILKTLTISHDTLSAATECVIKDGATVIWRGKLQTAAIDVANGAGPMTFDPPLIGTANTALNFALITSVTGGVYVNAQGYTGA